MKATWGACVISLSLLGCHSPGQYGHSRVYSPLGDEEDAQENAKDYDPIMAQRLPDQWKGKKVSLFGIVARRDAGQGGKAKLKLSVRTLEERNLCETAHEDSCRVTVSEREHAVVHALVTLSADDDLGKKSVGPGSLVRIIGKIGDDVDADDGTPIVRASYYRHWPRNFYVTTAARADMRR